MEGTSMSQATEASKIEPLMAALDWAYDKAVNGIPNLDRAEDLAESYLNSAQSADAAIDGLISWQVGKASIAGFLSGLGGVITLPIAVPANLLSVLWIQIRMIAAIAHIRGFDIRSDQVKTLVLGCLAGSSVADVMKDVGINVGSKLTQQAISKISGSTLMRVNQAIGFKLLTKAGTSGVVNLSKIIPFIGGVIGGAIDGGVTSAIGAAAKSTFRLQDQPPESSS
jgi:uncharacterized protein (DUF697 family)